MATSLIQPDFCGPLVTRLLTGFCCTVIIEHMLQFDIIVIGSNNMEADKALFLAFLYNITI